MIATTLKDDLRKNSNEKLRVLSGIATQILRGKDRWPAKPAPGDFFVKDSDWRQLCLNVHREGFLLLVGPSGCGKTEVIGLLAKTMYRSLHPFSFGAITEPRASLIGTTHFDPARGTYFQPSRFSQAIQDPNSIIRLDELNRTDVYVQNYLFSLLDAQRALHIDEQTSIASVAPGVSFFGTANVGLEYVGASKIDQALLDRADVVIRMDFPTREQESKLLIDRARITATEAELLTAIAKEQRRLTARQEFEKSISTRRLLRCAEQCCLGIPMKEALEYTVLGHYSDEGGSSSDRTRLQQLIQKFF
jgi:MoxR-like ATPase